MSYNYIPANPSGPTVKGEGCNYLISEIASSNPDDVKDVLLLCFVLCFVGSGLCDVLITAIDYPYPLCDFYNFKKRGFGHSGIFRNTHKKLANTCSMLSLL